MKILVGILVVGLLAPGVAGEAGAATASTVAQAAPPATPPTAKPKAQGAAAVTLRGTVEAVDGIVRRIRTEWPDGETPGVVATGGLAAIITPLSTTIEETDPQLTLQGLRLAAGHVGLRW